jgi:hypothetical protein
MTMSPNFFCAITNAHVAPTFPAPMTAIFFLPFAMMIPR